MIKPSYWQWIASMNVKEICKFPPPAVYYLKFKLLIDAERYEEAERDIHEALRHYPDYCTLHYYKGIVMYQLKKVREAIAAFEACLQTNNENHQYVQVKGAADFRSSCWLGVCHAELRQHMTAVLYLQKALNANPKCVRAQRLLSELTRIRPHMPDPFNILSYWQNPAMPETGINAPSVSLDKRGSFFLQQVYQFLHK